MIRYFKTFFSPTVFTYSYNQNKETVVSKIIEVFQNKVSFLSDYDLNGEFLSNDTFTINIISNAFTHGVKFSSTLEGQLIETQSGTTQIQTKIWPGWGLYILLVVAVIFGIAYFYKFIETTSTDFLFWSLAILIGGLVISFGVANVSNESLRERFLIYWRFR
jgi:hypothetical protein